MFLALREIKYSKLRYSLVIGLMFLIAYLVFFLTGLAYGLAQKNREAVDTWQADQIVLTDEVNGSLRVSHFSQQAFDQIKAPEKAELIQSSATVKNDEGDKIDVTFFGIIKNQFLRPDLVEGKMFSEKGEVVADISLKDSDGLNIGDQLKLSDGKELTIVGFTQKANFNVSPVLYMSQDTFYEATGQTGSKMISAVLVRGKVSQLPKGLDKLSISQFIEKLPGYRAQNITFSFMIGFLILIAALVIGIFIYILTLQKKAVFGVLKAQGVSSAYLAKSVIAQTFLLSLVAVGLGMGLTLLTALILPVAVPFQVNYLFFSGIGVLMVLMAVLGALFSILSIVKVDPLKAIG